MGQHACTKVKGFWIHRTDHGERLSSIKLRGVGSKTRRRFRIGSLLEGGTLPTVAFGLLWRTDGYVILGNVEPKSHTTNGRLCVGSKGNLAHHNILVGSSIVHRERYLTGTSPASQTEGSLLKHHTELVKDEVLRTELELKVCLSSHLQSNRDLVLLSECRYSLLGLVMRGDIGASCGDVVADECIEIVKGVVLTWVVEGSKRTVVVNGVQTFLMKSIDIAVRRQRIPLRFRMGEPGLLGAC
mmetsp:Transcript_30353/g.44900  ORF Transcript_30353/g.44900 Transcript_30353/m.44900 type:complete len:242 (+) Transcript_30353:2539-3264(+)